LEKQRDIRLLIGSVVHNKEADRSDWRYLAKLGSPYPYNLRDGFESGYYRNEIPLAATSDGAA
jgi:hypothetical protein